jgi:glycosyltransferase involved in cell wall biosynthesis
LNQKLLSIVICSYNRSDHLSRAIDSVLSQNTSYRKIEILIVDNGSTDNTKSLIEEKYSHQPGIRYIFEGNPGLSHARNRGWQEAQGVYVGFLDDDALASPKWLEIAQKIINTKSPSAFGGPYYPFYLSKKPVWFFEKYGSWTQGDQERCINESEYLVGGNLFIRRDLLIKYSGFNPNFGMLGNKIRYGEETELLKKIRDHQSDNCLYYVPELFIHHLVRNEKMTWKWIIRNKFADGRDYYNLFPERKTNHNWIFLFSRLLRLSILILLDIFVRVHFRDTKKYPYCQNYYYEHTMKYIAAFGVIIEQLKENVHQK